MMQAPNTFSSAMNSANHTSETAVVQKIDPEGFINREEGASVFDQSNLNMIKSDYEEEERVTPLEKP